MGKTKDLFIEQQENLIAGDKTEVKHSLNYVLIQDIPCPNCNANALLSNSKTEAVCEACGQEYTRTGNSFRFK